ncbi:MAG: DUF3368 domain-containing protein [Dehalococcoidia bacterium]
MPGILSDSSTLIHLAAIGRLTLLKEFYGKISIPPAVWREVVEEGKGRAGAVEVREAHQAGWLEIVSPGNASLVRLLRRDLDAGEAEVIALAVEQQSDLVVLDEAEARQIASLYSLRKTGVIGILMRAKREGKVPSLQAELDRLRDQAGFWIATELYHRALQAVGEGGQKS